MLIFLKNNCLVNQKLTDNFDSTNRPGLGKAYWLNIWGKNNPNKC